MATYNQNHRGKIRLHLPRALGAMERARKGALVGSFIFAVKVTAVTWAQSQCSTLGGSARNVWRLVKLLSALHLPPAWRLRDAGPLARAIRVLSAPFEFLAEPVLGLTVISMLWSLPGGQRLAKWGAAAQLPETSPRPGPEDSIRPQSTANDEDVTRIEEPVALPRERPADDQDDQDIRVLQALRAELLEHDIVLPDRLNEDDELRRYWQSSKRDMARCLQRLQSSAQWRSGFAFLSPAELTGRRWDRFLFWHGRDGGGRPALVVRLGLATQSLPWEQRHAFVQAIVSQMEHGVVHLAARGLRSTEEGRIAVLVDCRGCCAWKLPLGFAKDAALLLQRHYPVRLARGHAIHVPTFVGFVANAVLKAVGETTRRKIRVDSSPSGSAQAVAQLLGPPEQVPPFLGGSCRCERCAGQPEGLATDVGDQRPAATEHFSEAQPSEEDMGRAALPSSSEGLPPEAAQTAHSRRGLETLQEVQVQSSGEASAASLSPSPLRPTSAVGVLVAALVPAVKSGPSSGPALQTQLPPVDVRAQAQDEFTQRVAPHVDGSRVPCVRAGAGTAPCMTSVACRRPSPNCKDAAGQDGPRSTGHRSAQVGGSAVMLHTVRPRMLHSGTGRARQGGRSLPISGKEKQVFGGFFRGGRRLRPDIAEVVLSMSRAPMKALHLCLCFLLVVACTVFLYMACERICIKLSTLARGDRRS